ncbi:putative base plate hub [Klebsiella phage CPRSB]|nr:putative base plate hub [Klebsiella phage CPRSB]
MRKEELENMKKKLEATQKEVETIENNSEEAQKLADKENEINRKRVAERNKTFSTSS